MSETKSYCATHHFYYKGDKCPLCEKERIDSMAKKYKEQVQEEVKPVKNDRPINHDDLERLINKFNVK